MINGNLIDSTITNRRTQRLELPPPQAADMGGRGCWCSWRCNRAHWHSQYVPLKSTFKYDFGLHLSKTTFLEIQMVQQIAEAAVSSNKLCLLSPTLHHRFNRSSIEDGWYTKHYMNCAPQKLRMGTTKKQMLYSLGNMTVSTWLISIPITSNQIVFS